MARQLQTGSHIILKKINKELQESVYEIGHAMGLNDLNTIHGQIILAHARLKIAQRWMSRFIGLNSLPALQGETTTSITNGEAIARILTRPENPHVIDAEYSEVKADIPSHRDDCNRLMFATECSCGLDDALDGVEPPTDVNERRLITNNKPNESEAVIEDW